MADTSVDLSSAIAELDDEYLKVMLLLAIRRARSEAPRRAGFWHALAVALAEEQETRRSAAELRPSASAQVPEDEALSAVLEELRREVNTLEAEVRESVGDLGVAGAEPA
jgi:hypothetical protein